MRGIQQGQGVEQALLRHMLAEKDAEIAALRQANQQQLVSQLQQLLQCAAVTSLVLLHDNKQQQERIKVQTVVTDVLTAQLASISVSKAAIQCQLDRTGLQLQEAKAAVSALSEELNIVRQQLESDLAAVQDQLKSAAAATTSNNSTPTILTQLLLQHEQLLSPPNTPSADAATAEACASMSESSSPASSSSSAAQQDVSQAAELHPSTLLVAKKQSIRKAAQRKATLRTTKVIIPRWRW